MRITTWPFLGMTAASSAYFSEPYVEHNNVII